MTSEWPWTLDWQKYPVYIKYLPPRSKFSVHFTLWQAKVVENRQIGDAPNDLRLILNNYTLYILSTYPWGPNVCRFCSTTSYFQDTRLLEIRNFENVPIEMWLRNLKKYLIYTNYPQYSNLGKFCCTTFPFRDTRLSKSEIPRMTSKWPWTLGSQKYLAYTKYLPPGPKVSSPSLYDSRFQDTIKVGN